MKPLLRPVILCLRVVELILVTIAGAALLLAFSPRLVVPRNVGGGPRKLLALDAAYSLDVIRRRQLERSITARDLDGYFEHVWNVHPLVGANPNEALGSHFGPPGRNAFASRHTFLEGHVGRYSWLRALPFLNFFLAQAGLLIHLDRLICKEAIAVVRVGDPYFQGPLGLLLARRSGIPLVVRINGNYDAIYEATGRRAFPRLYPSRQFEKLVERFVLRRADLVVAPSADNLNFALWNGARPDRSAIFPYSNLVHPAHFVPPEKRTGPTSGRADVPLRAKHLLVYVGRLDPVKRAADLIDVLAFVRKGPFDVGLVLVGDGPLRPEMETRAEALGALDSIAFMGNRGQEWIAGLLPSCDIVVSPHMGRALVEAALSGRPLVAYDNDWQSELCITGRTGILVPVGDRHAMASAVVELLQDPKRAERFGAAARELVLQQMDPARLTLAERKAYERVLSGQPQPKPGADVQVVAQ